MKTKKMHNQKKLIIYFVSHHASIMMALSIFILLLQYWMMKTVNADQLTDYEKAIRDREYAVTPDQRATRIAAVFFAITVIIWICTIFPPEA